MIPSITDMALSHGHRSISPESASLLASGDITGLLSLQRSRFPGNFRMEKDDDKPDDDDDDTVDDDDDDDTDDDDDDDAKGKKTPEQVRIDELNAENKRRRVKAREQAAEIKRLREEAAKKPPAKKKKAGDDAEDEADDEKVVELNQKVESLERTNEDLLIRLEFTNLVTGEDAKHRFKNPSKALRLLDLDDVDITDKGEIEGLEDAIADLAKSDPYLLVDKDDDEDDEDDEEKAAKRKPGRKTGRKKGAQPNREALLKKYPALRR